MRKLRETRSRLPDAQGQFTGIGVVEQRPGTLVEHIGIDAVGPQAVDDENEVEGGGGLGVAESRECGKE